MSISMGMLAVLARDAVPRDQQEQVLARAMGMRAPLEQFSAAAEVFDLSAWLADGVMSLRPHPMGFDLVHLRWSPNVLTDSDALTETRMAAIERVAIACVDELDARFGYVTHYGNQLDEPWIEERVLVPLLCEDWEDLVSPLYHLVLHAADLPLVVARTAVIHESSKGRVVRLGEHQSPFGPLNYP